MAISSSSAQTNPDLLFVRAMMLHEQGFIDEAQPLYARVLQLRPAHTAALHLFGVTLFQKQEYAQAEVVLNAALVQEPNNSRILSDLGLVYFKTEDYPQALHYLNLAIQGAPDLVSAWNNRAAVFEKMGQLSAAFSNWEEAVRLQPDYEDALLNLGRNYRQQKSYESALRCFYQLREYYPERATPWRELALTFASDHQLEQALMFSETALAVSPNDAEQLSAHGLLFEQSGQPKQALSYVLAARTLQPEHADYAYQSGVLYEKLNDLVQAQAAYEIALQIETAHTEARFTLARLLMNQHQTDEALSHFDTLLAAHPEQAAYWQGKAHILVGKNQLYRAFQAYSQALRLSPETAEIWNDAAIVLQQAQHPQIAMLFAKQAIALDASLGSAWNTLGLIEFGLHRYRSSFKSLQNAERLDPQMHEVRWNLAHWHLVQGEWLQGWAGYEERFHTQPALNRHQDIPRWSGKPLRAEQTLLIHAEQGFGDTIQMIRYLPHLAEHDGHFVVEIHPQLRQLLTPFEQHATFISRGDAVPSCDFQCPMMSLPLMCGTTPDHVPMAQGYLSLSASPMLPAKQKFRVCFVAAGNPHHKNDKARSIAMRWLKPMFQSFDFEWVCLQPELSEQQKSDLVQSGILCPLDAQSDFSETAAWIEQSNLVITVDSAVAHLAGALGKPVWLMLAFNHDWRWMTERTDTPWYQSMRLFRQAQYGDWSSVMTQIHHALHEHAEKSGKVIAA